MTTVHPGQRVVLTFDTCGACPGCRAGAPALCAKQFVRNSGGDETPPAPRAMSDLGDVQLGFFGQSSFAEYAITTQRNTIAVGDGLPPELLAPLGCGCRPDSAPSATSCDRQPPTVAVFGAGTVGLSALCALQLVDGVAAVVVEPNPTRRRLAEELGAAVTIDGTHADLQGAIRGSLPQGLQGAVECSGHPSALAGAVASLARGGRRGRGGGTPRRHSRRAGCL